MVTFVEKFPFESASIYNLLKIAQNSIIEHATDIEVNSEKRRLMIHARIKQINIIYLHGEIFVAKIIMQLLWPRNIYIDIT